tara:strand:+ start:26 stop:484 length:459 start_codon:yes stop_codon:yes gene_type:complete
VFQVALCCLPFFKGNDVHELLDELPAEVAEEDATPKDPALNVLAVMERLFGRHPTESGLTISSTYIDAALKLRLKLGEAFILNASLPSLVSLELTKETIPDSLLVLVVGLFPTFDEGCMWPEATSVLVEVGKGLFVECEHAFFLYHHIYILP